MRTPVRKRITATAILIILTTMSGCVTKSPQEPPVAEVAAFPYPPATWTTSIAVELDDHLRSAAQFAVDLEHDELFALRDPYVAASMRSRVTRENVYPFWADKPLTPPQETGAVIYSATAAARTGPDTVDVTVCEYYSPGIYTLKSDGTLERFPADPEIKYAASISELTWTTAPDADGTTTAGPRWLLTGHGAYLNSPTLTAERDKACAPYQPAPFLTGPPAPTAER